MMKIQNKSMKFVCMISFESFMAASGHSRKIKKLSGARRREGIRCGGNFFGVL